MTLDGKSVTINGRTYYFDGGGYDVPENSSRIVIYPGETVQQVLNRLSLYSYDLQSAKLNDDGTVTLNARMDTLEETIIADGKTIINKVPNGIGTNANNWTVSSSEENSIAQVDGEGIKNNKPVYGNTAENSFTLKFEPLTDSDIENLKGNTLHIGNHTLPLSEIPFKVGMTKDDVGKAIADAVNGKGWQDIEVSYIPSIPPQDGELKITIKGLKTDTFADLSVYEETQQEEFIYKLMGSLNVNSLGIDCTVTSPPTLESGEICEITIPQNFSLPFLFQAAKNKKFLCYDSSVNGVFPPEGAYIKEKYVSTIDVKDKSPDEIVSRIAEEIEKEIYKKDADLKVTKQGNVLIVESNEPSQSMNLADDINWKDIPEKIEAYEKEIIIPKTFNVLGKDLGKENLKKYLKQEVTVPFSLNKPFNPSDFAGKGFGIENSKFEFVNGTQGIRSDYTDIDISGCTTFEQFRETFERAIQSKIGRGYTVSFDDSSPDKIQMKISFSRKTNSLEPKITDGYHGKDGLFTNSGDSALSEKFSGGTDVGHSQKVIDFSSINDSNLDTLLGKGFRVNCATCPGEYINIFFCWENNGNIPESFEVQDPLTGKPQTIHNISVELSKVSSGDKIVENIVNQIQPALKHYTDVAIGDPTTQLIVMDKRFGDVKDKNEVLQLGSIMSGIMTNFEYTVEKEEIKEPVGADGAANILDIEFGEVKIFVGSDPEPEWIPIRLPYLDLEELNLCPPKPVDLNKDPGPAGWMERVDAANKSVAYARGRVGADYNRLEHAREVLNAMEINTADAESRIRDADMAELMMQQIKDQIIEQSQMSMIAHANAAPQQILQLLQ